MEKQSKPSKLEKIAASIAGGIIGAEYLLCYNNFDLHISGARLCPELNKFQKLT